MIQTLASILFFAVFIEAFIALTWYIVQTIARYFKDQQKKP